MGSFPFLQCTGETSRPGLPGNHGFAVISLAGRASLHYLPTPAQLATPAAGPRGYFDYAKSCSEQENENY